MGKASRKKQPASPVGKPAGSQADKLTSPVRSEASHEGKSAGRASGLLSKPIIHLFIIALLGFLAYSNTFQSPFQWDESIFMTGNPIVRDLGFFAEPSRAAGLPVYDGLKSRYIGYLTFALNYRLHGVNVFGYHLVNLVIHLINAMLVYLLVLLTFRTPYFQAMGNGLWARGELPGDSRPTEKSGTYHQGRYADFSLFTIHDSRFFAFAVALFFVAHPIQTEAVTYVFQRLASLVSMFYLLSLVLYIKSRFGAMGYGQEAALPSRGESRGGASPMAYRLWPIALYLLSLISAVLAMKTKENAFTLPLIITLYEFLFFSGPLKARGLRLVPFLLTMLIIPMTIIGLDSTAGEIISQTKDPASLGYQELTRGEYLFTQFRVIITYIRLLFFPAYQNIDYDYPIYISLFAPPVLLSFLFLAALFGIAVWLIYKSRLWARGYGQEEESRQKGMGNEEPAGEKKKGVVLPITYHPLPIAYLRLIGFGILWFFITLSVESSIIPIPMVIDEYRAYLPSVGFFIALIAGVALLLTQNSRFTVHGSRYAKIVAAVFMTLVAVLAAATYARNTLWKDKVSLWEDVVAKSPNSPRGYNNLGIAYNEKGMIEKAIAMYEHCIKLNPSQKDVHINLGVAYAMSNRFEKAIEEFTKAISITPGNSVLYANLARAYAQTDQFDNAAEFYKKAAGLDPFNSNAYHGLGTSYMRLGRVEDAIQAYTKFVSLNPRDPDAYRNRAIAYSQKGDLNSAREDFQKACSLGSRQGCESLERLR